jgi:hypothetical protein
MTNQDTELFIKLYRSFLSSGGTLEIEQLISPYIDMKPFLHQKAGLGEIDSGAFIYSLLRLPNEIYKVKEIILAQSIQILKREGYDTQSWIELSAPARRRKMYFDGNNKLYVIINSVTDVDDLVCLLTAFQIEWNKLRNSLLFLKEPEFEKILNSRNFGYVNRFTKIDNTLWQKLYKILKENFEPTIRKVREFNVEFKVKLLRGSYIDYVNSTQEWFENIVKKTQYSDFKEKPIYFVSSNTHSIVNNITGFVNSIEADLIKFMEENKMDDLLNYYNSINLGKLPGSKENLLWYVLKKYEAVNPNIKKQRLQRELELGIDSIEAKQVMDVNVQIIKVNKLNKSHLPDKIRANLDFLETSEAIIFNIDYPLGFGAYMILSTLLRNIQNIKGVYILGKASFLNGKLGDIALPTRVFDDHTKNTFVIKNAFTKEHFSEFEAGSLLSDQHALSTKGTLLHPEETMKGYFIDGYTVIEMENGPYLNALYETIYYDRYPENTLRDMLKSHIDLGIIHYASDTPFTKSVTLGTRSLGYDGIEATYVSSLAILRRIIEMESRN